MASIMKVDAIEKIVLLKGGAPLAMGEFSFYDSFLHFLNSFLDPFLSLMMRNTFSKRISDLQ